MKWWFLHAPRSKYSLEHSARPSRKFENGRISSNLSSAFLLYIHLIADSIGTGLPIPQVDAHCRIYSLYSRNTSMEMKT